MKLFIFICFFILVGASYTLKDSSFFWLPDSVRILIFQSKFKEGDCVSSERLFGVNPKRVIGLRFKGERSLYLLRDVDKYEHDQLIAMSHVDKFATRINCKSK